MFESSLQFNTDLNNIKDELNAQIKSLRDSLERFQHTQPQPTIEFEDVVNEVMERQKRKCNLIVFGITVFSYLMVIFHPTIAWRWIALK